MNVLGAKYKVPRELVISGSLVLFSIIMCVLFPTLDRVLCMMAMFLSCIGDILLTNIGNLRKRIPQYFQFGAMAFAIAHALYSAAYICLLREVPGWSGAWNAGTWSAFTAIAGLLCFFVGICTVKKNYKYLWLIAVYIVFIGTNFSIILTYVWEVFPLRWSALGAGVGATAFVVSDCCLGLGRVAGTKKLSRFVWIFYPIGQLFLIMCG